MDTIIKKEIDKVIYSINLYMSWCFDNRIINCRRSRDLEKMIPVAKIENWYNSTYITEPLLLSKSLLKENWCDKASA